MAEVFGSVPHLQVVIEKLKDQVKECQREADAEIARLRAENEKMREALVKIDHEYENKDLNHVDFRVLAKIMASEVLLTNGE